MSRIRITGGSLRSRLIDVPDIPGLRPTPDRVRETLFNWLGQDLNGLRCLDLFAGTGVLGFEAHSRGASEVCLVERNPRLAGDLEKTRRALNAEHARVVRRDALQSALSERGGWDVVFLDPPYQSDWLVRLEPLLDRLLHPHGALYVEADHPVLALGSWQAYRSGTAGQVCFQLMERRSS